MSVTLSRGYFSNPEGLSELVRRVDLARLVESYSGPGRVSPGRVTFSCPNPAHQDRHPSFTVTTASNGKQLARCWSLCDFRGDALALVVWLEGCSIGEAAKRLYRWLGEPESATPAKVKATPNRKPRTVPAKETRTLPAETASRLMSRYLSRRGWPSSVVESFSLSVVLDERGEPRIRHPYFAPNNSGGWSVAYYQDRALGESRVKWLSPTGVAPVLYNLRSLESDELTGVVICEGPADTISATLALEGVSSVAVIGVPGVSAWIAEYAPLLSGLRVVIAADNDAAGERLEAAIVNTAKVSAGIYRAAKGDLTETALELGLAEVRAGLLSRLGPIVTGPRLDPVQILLQVFPGAVRVKGGAK